MKNKVENTIKNQLEQREIHVSENAWERLSQMMEEQPVEKKKSKILPIFGLIGVAASVVIFIVIWAVNPSENKVEIETQISKNEKVNTTEKVESLVTNEKVGHTNKESNSFKITEKPKIVLAQNITEEKSQIEEPFIVESNQVLIKKEIELADNSLTPAKFVEPKVDPTEIASSNIPDSVPTEKTKKKKNFVDPDMLLYSVENNDAIKETKSDSRLVIIDFNK